MWTDTTICYSMPCQYRTRHSRGVGRYHHSTKRQYQGRRSGAVGWYLWLRVSGISRYPPGLTFISDCP
eukprot:3027921-Rhodomonas_salina.2